MSIKTYSAFIYGHTITSDNSYINFSEGANPELAAQITVGSYTLSEFVNAVSLALNSTGNLEYNVSLNRNTRKITISASSTFSLLVESGTQAQISAFNLMGFEVDKNGSSTYEADIASGSLYEPQYKLQRYVDFLDIVKTSQSNVNTSASGIVEVVSFGQNNFMECNITYATDIIGQGAIKNNPNGVAALRDFMTYAIQKKPLEFLVDIDSPEVFIPCILESTRDSSDGTSFQLYELYSRGLANYFETQALRFRRI